MILMMSALTSFWVMGARNEQLTYHSAMLLTISAGKSFTKDVFPFFDLDDLRIPCGESDSSVGIVK